MKRILCAAAIFLIHTPAQAGGWAEPVYPPQPVCEPFLWWRICDVENPSPKRTDKDEKERPTADDTPVDRETRDPAPDGGPAPSIPSEPPAAPEAPALDKPPKTPDVDPPVNKEPPAKPKPPKKDSKPGHGYGDKNHDHKHKNKEPKR